MKKELLKHVEKIKQSKASLLQKSFYLVSLSENAYNEGDMKAYDYLLKEVYKLNPPHVDSLSEIRLNPLRINNSPLPDIDFD